MRYFILFVALFYVHSSELHATTSVAVLNGTVWDGWTQKTKNGETTFLEFYGGDPFTMEYTTVIDNPGSKRYFFDPQVQGIVGEGIRGSVGEGYDIPLSAYLTTPHVSVSVKGNYSGYSEIWTYTDLDLLGFAFSVSEVSDIGEPGFESTTTAYADIFGFIDGGRSLNPLGRLSVSFEGDTYYPGGGGYGTFRLRKSYSIGEDDYVEYVYLSVIGERLKYVVEASAVPELDTWSMLLAGFGLVGWTVRNSRRWKGEPRHSELLLNRH